MEPRDTSMPNHALDKTLNEGALNEAAESENTPQTAMETPATEITASPEVETPASASPEEITEETQAEPAPATLREPANKESVIAALKLLSEKEAQEISSDEVSRLKQQFYGLRNEEQRAEREAFVAVGNAPEAFVPEADPLEEEFKALLAVVKEKKAAQRAAIEAEHQANYERKKAIVDKILEMGADVDNANRFFQQVRDLQTEFKEIGDVPAPVAADLWKNYQDAVEKFYDQLKINKELRDYDFKKNLSEKQVLVAEAEKLLSEEDVIVAFRRLQTLHEQWRAIGPVPKEVREEIWGRFKDISAEINKRQQAYFEERKSREHENEMAKEAICERVEGYDFSNLSTYSAWDEMTKLIIAAQDEWKNIGFTSRRTNNLLFARFRETCDKFFSAKAEFFREMKDTLARNLEKKIALCEKAEALKDSTDWRRTAGELSALQKEWKSIGAVPKKHSDQVWHRFLAACHREPAAPSAPTWSRKTRLSTSSRQST